MRYGVVESRLGQPAEARFQRAREIGFDAVELEFPASEHESRPLWTEEGARRVRQLAAEAGVALPSVCATYFNRYAFASPDASERERCVEVLRRLIDTSAAAGLRTILLPFFGPALLADEAAETLAAEMVGRCTAPAATAGVRLGIEATLPVDHLRRMAALAGAEASGAVGVYYDVGNVCAAGYDVAADLAALAGVLVGVHVKERTRRDEAVPFGQGDVDLATAARGLRAAGYDGYVVLETSDPRSGDDLETVIARNRANLDYVRRFI